TKWTGRTSSIKTLVDMVAKYDIGVNLIKFTHCLQADILGDWREEQIYYDDDTFSHLKIFSTTYPTDYSIPTLMHDHQYRMATVWQTSAYNQPPHLSYYLPDYVQALQDEAAAIQEISSESIDRRAKLICKEGRLYIQKDNLLYDLTGNKQSK
ncbi:MAG: rhamnogalacturonan lyase, partial [Bacteroidales bacterium]|nr:rhamnogalacturonan lyase [Bacteroidales bacterium]